MLHTHMTSKQQKIIVTRPDPHGTELCQFINASGCLAYHLPTIEIAPTPEPGAYYAALGELGEQDWLIFISPQAVYASVADIRRIWPQLPPQVKFAGMGEGTAKALQSAGYTVAALPVRSFSSEGLLDLPQFQTQLITGKNIAIIRGDGGREVVDTVLAARGANVLPIIAYQRKLPQMVMVEYQAMLKQHHIDMIVCSSFEGVRNLKIMFGQVSWPLLKEVPLIVSSERIKILAHDLGFHTVWVSRNASHKAILDVISSR